MREWQDLCKSAGVAGLMQEWQGLRKSAWVVWHMLECGNDRVYIRKGLMYEGLCK